MFTSGQDFIDPPACSVPPGSQGPDMSCPALVQGHECWPNLTPCGKTESQQWAAADRLNATFSQNAWAAAQQEACLGCPDRSGDRNCSQLDRVPGSDQENGAGGGCDDFPRWPAQKIYPDLALPHEMIVGQDPNFAVADAPYLQANSAISNYAQAASLGGSPNNPPNVPGNSPPIQYTQKQVVPHWPNSPGNPGATMGAASKAQQAPAEANVFSGNILEEIGNALRGSWYDFRHWSALPVSGFWAKLRYVFGRDSRGEYWLIFLSAILLISLVLYLVFRNFATPNRPPVYAVRT